MSIEEILFALLGPLFAGRVYPDTTPDEPTFPLAIYQQVGGQAIAYVDKTLPDHRHSRMQVAVWSRDRLEASTLARQIERAIIGSPLVAQAYGAPVSTYEGDLKLYGSIQHFGIWFLDNT